ncbi:MAG: TIGR00341 family protein [Methyloprofundus sp.]|nr:TIGR00341 family protein [Methyloprofundus sp.]
MTLQKKIYFIYSPCVEVQLDDVISHSLLTELGIEVRKIKLANLSAIHIKDDLNHALVWIEQKDYPQVLSFADQKQMSLGFLPIPGDPLSQFYKSLDLPKDFDSCLEIALHDDPLFIDIIACNNEIVTNGVNLENQTTMTEFMGDSHEFTGLGKFKFTIKRVIHAFSLTPHPVTLITAKGKTVSTAITGMVLLDFHRNGALTNLFTDSISLRDRRISVVLFAPQSILSYLQLSSKLLASSKKKNLPQELGYIRTASLTIKSPVDTHFLVNNKPLTTRELCIEILNEGVKVNAGDKFRDSQHYADDKENVNCKQLPQQDSRIKYLSSALPFFTHALESDFKDLFLALKENAKTTNTFVLLMILSTLLATLGLFLNSPSVVIGAMVLAPLMSPIISSSMGLLRSDSDLSRRSFSTLLTGMFIALFLSALMAFVLPFQEITNEIEGRLHPSTLDLLVAVLSGVAGAFANARENIAKSLPGVAIAVALVPPLCVSGIGIGWLNFDVFYGAMLLFLTNLTGIIMAAGVSFMAIGFAPFSRAKKGIAVSVFMVAIISVPLVLSFSNMQTIAAVKKQLLSQNYEINGQLQQLRNIKVRLGTPMKINGDLITTSTPNPQMLLAFEQHLSNKLHKAVTIDLSVRLVTESYFKQTLLN